MSEKFLAIVGPTSSGKSDLALFLAEKLNGEIVSCDSVQIYRDLNIGSAKPNAEERQRVVHHMIDLIDVDQPYDAGDYAKAARLSIQDIAKRNKLPILVGGTGLYLRALLGEQWDNIPSDPTIRQSFAKETLEKLYDKLKTLDPERAEQLHPNDRFRIERALEIVTITGKPVSESYSLKSGPIMRPILFLNPSMMELDERIKGRTQKMLKDGLVNETERVLKRLGNDRPKVLNSIGYFEASAFLEGKIAEKDLENAINIATHQYAKRQKTWFRKINAPVMLTSFATHGKVLELAKILVDKF